MNNDYLGLWLQFRLWLFVLVSVSWSLLDEFGHVTCCDPVSQLSRRSRPGGCTIFNLYYLHGCD